MTRKQKKSASNKEELKNVDPSLRSPTQNIEKNLAEGEGSISPDPDDIPGGWDSTLNQQFSKRPDVQGAEGQAYQREAEIKTKQKNKKKIKII